jgi:carbonic anhydrase/acetyltransferase-like protein (isoleucine patch superfamily)
MLVGACGGSESQQGEHDAQASQQQAGSAPDGGGLINVGRHADVIYKGGSYVSPLTEVYGDVLIGRDNFIAANSVMRAAPGYKVVLGEEATAQDNVIVRAQKESVTIGDQSNLGHHAIVRDSQIGDSAYIGYNTEVDDSRIGDGSLIYHGARVEGVEIPAESYVGAGEIVTDQSAADDLPTIQEEGVSKYYQESLLDVHKELTKGYAALYKEKGFDSVMEVGPNPKTSWHEKEVEPQIAKSDDLDEFARIVGDVRLGENSFVGRRTAIRADEGYPIVIGPGASIDDRVTFHAVKGTDVRIGKFLSTDDDAVLHGPLVMGDRDFVGEDTVVFRARIGDDVQIGQGAIIVGPDAPGDKISLEIPDDTVVPANAVVTSEKDVKALEG